MEEIKYSENFYDDMINEGFADEEYKNYDATGGKLKDGDKTYKVKDSNVGFTGGRYIGSNVLVAAKKAASKMFSKNNSGNLRQINFIMVETTRGCKKKETGYVAEKVKLKKPVVINRNGVAVSYEFTIKLTRFEIKKSSSK